MAKNFFKTQNMNIFWNLTLLQIIGKHLHDYILTYPLRKANFKMSGFKNLHVPHMQIILTFDYRHSFIAIFSITFKCNARLNNVTNRFDPMTMKSNFF